MIFVHFLNDQILALYSVRKRFPADWAVLARKALRYCLTFSRSGIRMPTVDLVQSPAVPFLADMLRAMLDFDLISLVGSTPNVESLISRKQRHYSDSRVHPEWYSDAHWKILETYSPALVARATNTTRDLIQRWNMAIASVEQVAKAGMDASSLGAIGTRQFMATQLRQAVASTESLSDRVTLREFAAVPTRLEGHAFLNSVVNDLDILREARPSPEGDYRIETALAYAWLRSHVDEYGPWYVGRLPRFGWIDCGLRFDTDAKPVDIATWARVLDDVGLRAFIDQATPEELASCVVSAPYALLRDNFLISAYRAAAHEGKPEDYEVLSLMARPRKAPTRRRRWTLPEAVEQRLEYLLGGSVGRVSASSPLVVPNGRYDIFLAHPSSDRATARELFDLLQPHVRVFLDSASLGPGDNWARDIPSAQRASRVTVIIVSRRSVGAWYLGDEVVTGIELHRRSPNEHTVVPVLLDVGVELPYGLAGVNAIDAAAVGGLAGVAERLRMLVATKRMLRAESAM